MQKYLFHFSIKHFALCLLFISLKGVAEEKKLETYEDLMARLLEKQDVANLSLFDRALRTPSNKFERRFLLSLGNLASSEASREFQIRSGALVPTKDLRQEAASKILLSGIVKPEDLYREYSVNNQRLSDNPRELASLSSPLMSFLYYQAYKKREGKQVRDEELEKAIVNRFNEQSARAKAEMIDPLRTQVLSNCDDAASDMSVSLVALSAVPKDTASTLDVVTHHFVYPQVNRVSKLISRANPKLECENKAAELKKTIENARQSNSLLLLNANANYFNLEPFESFNTGEFLLSCRDSFARLWSRYKGVAESSMPLSEAYNQRLKKELVSEITFCKNTAKEDMRRVSVQRSEVAKAKEQRLLQVDLTAHDNQSWAKAYSAVSADPNLRLPDYPDLNPSLSLVYKNMYPVSDETLEQKQERLKIEAENKILAEQVRVEQRAEQEAVLKANLEAESLYLNSRAQWDKAWSDGYAAIVRGENPKSFEDAMKDLVRARSSAESSFLASQKDDALLKAKFRIEDRARASIEGARLLSYAPASSAEYTPEYFAKLSVKREAEFRAQTARLKAHEEYVLNKSSIPVPTKLSENQKQAFISRYLDKLEADIFQREYEKLMETGN